MPFENSESAILPANKIQLLVNFLNLIDGYYIMLVLYNSFPRVGPN